VANELDHRIKNLFAPTPRQTGQFLFMTARPTSSALIFPL
jgi:hypothetical protein